MIKKMMLLTCLTLILALFTMQAHGATVQLPQTGQTSCYDAAGTVIACTGTGQDGDKRAGVAWPSPRFTDNTNGTVTDNLTGLIWLKNVNCFSTSTWQQALTNANSLASGACGLTDSSTAGQWRLPNILELESLVDLSRHSPALPVDHMFSGVQLGSYWSSNSGTGGSSTYAWYVHVGIGYVAGDPKSYSYYVWPVRGGQ